MIGPELEYRKRLEASQAEAKKQDDRSALYGHSRVVLVVIAAVLGLRAYLGGLQQPQTVYLVLAAIFVVLLVLQSAADKRRRRVEALALHHKRSLARLAGQWVDFPSRGERFADTRHAYARDLDVVGRGSLFQLTDTTRTEQGASTLASFLLAPASLNEIEARRQSVRALAPELDARESMAVSGLDAEVPDDVSHVDPTPLVEWAEGPPLLELPAALRWAIPTLPVVTLVALFAMRAGVIPVWPVLVLVTAHLALIIKTRPAIGALAARAEKAEKALVRLLPLLRAAVELPGDTPRLVALRQELAGAVEATTSLRRRVTLFQSRANLIVAVVSPLLLWEQNAALLLQAWQRGTGTRLRGWFAALGEMEALCALSTYTYEHPDDVWPELVDGPLTFEAADVGHPLLPTDRCVRNDVSLGGPGTLLLITGSNMSGKSTLLRAVGLNAVLALAGLPVRARRLRTSRLQIATSMRVSDSLQEGASFFAAELSRLKRVVDMAHEELPVLFLLDEILQGTNTRERSLGARGVVAHLLDAGAMGLVSTHDLSLVQLGERLGDRVQYAHFEDQLTDDRMTFDYRMRPGVVRTSNALRLMRAIGLAVEIPREESEPAEPAEESVEVEASQPLRR